MRDTFDPKAWERAKRFTPPEPPSEASEADEAPVYTPRIPSREEMLRARERL